MKNKQVKIIQREGKPEVPAEVIADAIVELSRAAKKMSVSRLNRRAICVLLNDETGIGMNQISILLDALPALEEIYLKPKPK